MIKIKTVFLDMDEVLVDFNKGVFRVFDLPYQYKTFFPEYHYFAKIGQTTESLAKYCTFDFWEKLEWMQDGHEILRAVTKKFDTKNIWLLTTFMPSNESPGGKMMWLEKQLPVYSNRVILIPFGVPKSLLARPDTLLIDDKDKNIDEFVAAGGQGILVPRPWNRAYKQAGNSANVVREQLEKLI